MTSNEKSLTSEEVLSDQAPAKPFYGWKLVTVFFFVYLLNGAFPFYGGTVINVHMAESMGLNRTILGSAVTAYMFSVGIVAMFVGFIIQRVGVKASVLTGGLILIAGSLLMAFYVDSATKFILVFGVLNGIGSGLGSLIPIQTGLNFWFHRRRALAMSIVFCAAGAGAIIVTPLVQQVISLSNGDWQLAWQVITCFLVVSLVITTLFVVSRPEDIGQEVDGGMPLEESSSSSSSKVYKTTENWTVKEALSTSTFWIIVFGGITFILLFNMVVAHGVAHLLDQGIGPELAAVSTGLLIMFSILGRLFAGAVGDHIELRFVWGVAMLICAAGLYSLTLISSSSHVYTYTLVCGIGIGICYVCGAALIGNYYGQQSFAPLFGLASSCMALFGSMSPLVAGIIYDSTGSYNPAIYGITVLVLFAALLAPLAGPPKRKLAS